MRIDQGDKAVVGLWFNVTGAQVVVNGAGNLRLVTRQPVVGCGPPGMLLADLVVINEDVNMSMLDFVYRWNPRQA